MDLTLPGKYYLKKVMKIRIQIMCDTCISRPQSKLYIAKHCPKGFGLG